MALRYPAGYIVRRVASNGEIKIRNMRIGISMALSGYDAGLEGLDEVRYALWFGRLCLGR